MTTEMLMGILAIGTLSAVVVWAVLSKRATEKRRKDPNAPKSTLAEDAPNSKK